MKKQFLTLASFLVLSSAMAQPYGQQRHPNASRITSGEKTSINSPGFLMAGIENRIIGGTNYQVIHVDKTDVGGNFNGNSWEFTQEWRIREGTAPICSNGTGYLTTQLIGVSAIETNSYTSGERYALTGAYDAACFFALLDSIGDTLLTMLYPFPYQSAFVTKPIIVEEPQSTGQFFIAGQFDSTMYVMKVNLAGSVLWSGFYHCGTPSYIFDPRDMIISGHNNDLIIVGHVSPDLQYNRASDGFFLSLNPTNGNVNNFVDYSSTPCNWFNSVETAYCNAGGVGYVIGGYSDGMLGTSRAWMIKIDVNGQIIWNTLINGGTPGTRTSDIMGVVERVNSVGNYEYYGVSRTADIVSAAPASINNITVFKLDASGNPFTGVNEYHYSSSLTSQLDPINLTLWDVSAINDVGLHIYANNSSNHYFIESYFNGITGCNNESFTNIDTVEAGPTDIQPWISRFGNLSPCNEVCLVPAGGNWSPNIICSASSVTGGSNAKIAVGIGEQKGENSLRIYPNPGEGIYTIEVDSDKHIALYNILGQELLRATINRGKNVLDIEDQENGQYLLKITDGNETKNLMLIKQ